MKERRVKAKSIPWMNDEVLNAMRVRDRLLRKFSASKKDDDWNMFKKQRNYVVNLVVRTKAEYFETTVEENWLNPRALWSTLKQVLYSGKKFLPCRIKDNDKFLTIPVDIANKFNSFFTTIAEKLTQSLPEQLEQPQYPKVTPQDCKFNIPDMTEDFVKKEIEKMSLGKATGLDGISVKLLKISKHTFWHS